MDIRLLKKFSSVNKPVRETPPLDETPTGESRVVTGGVSVTGGGMVDGTLEGFDVDAIEGGSVLEWGEGETEERSIGNDEVPGFPKL